MHGGKRSGAGRKPGVKSKRTKEREQAMSEAAERLNESLGEGSFEGDAHTLLMAIYKDMQQPLPLRLDAAKAAIGYEKPKLSSVDAKVDGVIGQYAAQPIPVEQRDSDSLAGSNGSAANGHTAGHG